MFDCDTFNYDENVCWYILCQRGYKPKKYIKDDIRELPKPRYKFLDLTFTGICQVVTLCYLEDDDGMGIGVSICNNQDDYRKKVGKHIAYGRAVKAFNTKKSNNFIKKSEYLPLRRYGVFALSYWVGK